MTSRKSRAFACTMRVATLLATALLIPLAHAAELRNLGYVVDQNYRVVISGTGECVRSGVWTPALAAAAEAVAQCTPDLVPPKPPAPKAAPPAKPAPKPAPPAAKAPAKPEAARATPAPQKIEFSADALFDFDKAVLKAEGVDKLNALPGLLQGASYQAVRATGHTDRIGTARYNDRLSLKRAEAVRKFLVDKGVPASRIVAEGKGESQPKTTPATCRGKKGKALIACLQPDRRVVVEVTGTK